MTDNDSAVGGDIELADAVEALRDQLVEAASRANGRPIAFELGDIEMEFTVELRKQDTGGARVKAWVLEAGADRTRSVGRTHRVAFTLRPKDARTGRPWEVGNDDLDDLADFGEDGGDGAGRGTRGT